MRPVSSRRRTRSATTSQLCEPTKPDPFLARSLKSSSATRAAGPAKSPDAPPRSRHRIRRLEPRRTGSRPAPLNHALLENEVAHLSDRAMADRYARWRPASDRAAQPLPASPHRRSRKKSGPGLSPVAAEKFLAQPKKLLPMFLRYRREFH